MHKLNLTWLFSLVLVLVLISAGCQPSAEEAVESENDQEAASTETTDEGQEAETETGEEAASAPTERNAADDGVIKLGFVADVSGVGYLFSQSQLAGLKIALEEINAEGGILGQQVEYVMHDAQLKPDVGATLARQMILEDNVDFLLGPTSSSVALAVSEVAKEYKVPLAIHTSNTVELTTGKGHKYLFQVVPHTTIEARAAAQYAADLPYTQWAVIGPDYSFGHDEHKAFTERISSLNSNAEIINVQWPALGERDLTAFITAMQANAPEAVFSSLWGDQLVTFVQQAGSLGLFEESSVVGLFDTDFMKATGDELPEGLLGFARAPFYAIDTEQMQSFIEKHQTLTKEYPSDWAIMMYDAVYGLKAAAEKAGTTDGDAVANALDDLTFQSLRGELTIRACDHMANVGEYIGTTVHSDEFPFPIMEDVTYVPAEDVWHSCEEIEEMRAASE